MKVKKVSIIPGCISCGTCEVVCPQVFEVKGVSEVRPNADVRKYSEECQEAADLCPVSVIKVEKE